MLGVYYSDQSVLTGLCMPEAYCSATREMPNND